MKRVIYGLSFFLLLIFEAAFASVGWDYWKDGEWAGTLFCIFLCVLMGKGIVSCYRKAFKPEVIVVPQPMAPGTMMPGGGMPGAMMQNGQPMVPGEPNPEMDHLDDMSMQYNPYFSEVYEEQLQQQRQQQEIMQRQLAEQQLLAERQRILQEQMENQQRMQQQMEAQKQLEQELQNQRMAQDIINGPGRPMQR